jgi:hypothetical protein
VVRWGTLEVLDALRGPETCNSTGHFLQLRYNKGGTDRCAHAHTYTCLHCLYAVIVRDLNRLDWS